VMESVAAAAEVADTAAVKNAAAAAADTVAAKNAKENARENQETLLLTKARLAVKRKRPSEKADFRLI
jgi:hypothetical protein